MTGERERVMSISTDDISLVLSCSVCKNENLLVCVSNSNSLVILCDSCKGIVSEFKKWPEEHSPEVTMSEISKLN